MIRERSRSRDTRPPPPAPPPRYALASGVVTTTASRLHTQGNARQTAFHRIQGDWDAGCWGWVIAFSARGVDGAYSVRRDRCGSQEFRYIYRRAQGGRILVCLRCGKRQFPP